MDVFSADDSVIVCGDSLGTSFPLVISVYFVEDEVEDENEDTDEEDSTKLSEKDTVYFLDADFQDK